IGGSGVIRSYRALTDNQFVTATFGRHKFVPWGVNGGRDGSANEFYIIKANGEVDGPFGKYARYPLNKGDVVKLITATGGGYGNPLDRAPEKVAFDVKTAISAWNRQRRFSGLLSIRKPSKSWISLRNGSSGQNREKRHKKSACIG